MHPFLSGIIGNNGGFELWQQHATLHVELRFGGLAFASRWNRKGLRRRRARVFLHEQKVIFENYLTTGCRGIYTPENLCLETPEGNIFAGRRQPRAVFGSFRRQLWWDDLDLLYFAGYALWNYLTMPWLLTFEGVEIQSVGDWEEAGETWKKLTVQFPAGIATHSTIQTFYFDKNYRLRRHDYTPEVFVSWAKAAHYCLDHQNLGGLQFPLKRLVFPRKSNGIAATFPTLVFIEITAARFDVGAF